MLQSVRGAGFTHSAPFKGEAGRGMGKGLSL